MSTTKNKSAVVVKDIENIQVSGKPEIKKEISQEEKTEASAPSEVSQPLQVMSETDSLVSNLVKETPTEFPSLTKVVGRNPNLLALPEECDKLHKKTHRFRWLANDKRLRSKLHTGIWILCTKINCPFIKEYRFKAHGAVEQAGMLLAFCTEEMAQAREQMPAKKSADLVKHYTEEIHQTGDFYKPENAGDDDDDGFIEGRDF